MKLFLQKHRFLLLLICLCISKTGITQVLQPAKWTYSFADNSVKVGKQTDIIFNIKIDKGWYMYSSDFDPDLGPMVTSFKFQPNNTYELVGNPVPIHAKKKHSDIWGGTYSYFINHAEFKQKIKIRSEQYKVAGNVSYQVCTEADGKCVSLDERFSVVNEPTKSKSEKAVITTSIKEDSLVKIAASDTKIATKITEIKVPQVTTIPIKKTSESLLTFMFLAFMAGLAALLTPCVFPMIPMTVTFFTNTSKDRKSSILKALIYGFSIVFIYTLVGTIVAKINGPEFANWLSTHWLPNLMFFVIFIFFGLSFLGLFEIVLPHSLVNKMDKEADKGGYYGIIFMAFTIVLVSFSCTGPIVGSILVESAGGAILKPIAGMFAFSMAFAIPFTLFAIFPNWLKSLPKSGGWLNSVKVVLGFLELALALKFLSTADQVYHWRILDREIFLVVWIAIFSCLGLYLLGKIRLPHDSETKSVSVPRLLASILTFAFVFYLIPGLWGAPLKVLAGFLPPMHTQDFNLNSLTIEGSDKPVSTLCETPENPASLTFPHGIQGYFNLEQAIACAKKQHKPVFIDFTGHGCVNCRKMEENVWVAPPVMSRLKNDFVMVALYIDEKMELPESKWYTSAYDGKVKTTIGSQNADLQITHYQNNAQPYYVILDPNTKELLVNPVSYETDIAKFTAFLDTGINAFKKVSK
ncbi:cytochrome c biogenesis protein CcdA [Arcicella sp. LKC2W]|uniref:protein-disulfide reductase DsbD family protein n=1 Tax=Arcicella sp. LKC2W TaxID=2984198 RepID=UPI002B21DF69|nr:cytochrome c biogenesis protein CcdA [Arcicella sp. LKC2W]MEA5461072.1 cytochrome c biogenesis protein CcdA [Arcicella sp. LKC2W]